MDMNFYFEHLKAKTADGTVLPSDIKSLNFDLTMNTRRLLRRGSVSEIRDYEKDIRRFMSLYAYTKDHPEKYKYYDEIMLQYKKFVELRRFCIAVLPSVNEYADDIKEYLYKNPISSMNDICEALDIRRVDAEKAIQHLKDRKEIIYQNWKMVIPERDDNTERYELTDNSRKQVKEEIKKLENTYFF